PPLQSVTWSVITWTCLKRSTGRRREERNISIRGLAPSSRGDRDDSNGHVLGEEREAAIRRGLGRASLRNPVIHELREDAFHNLLADAGHRDGRLGPGIQSRSEDRGVADAARQHERGASRRRARSEPAATVPCGRTDGPVKIDSLPLSGISREFALPDFREALLEAPSGFGRRG